MRHALPPTILFLKIIYYHHTKKVSDPVQHSEGMNKYTSYRVDVRPQATNPGDDQQDIMLANNSYSAVLRRYSDFLWLYDKLHVERAGAVVPPMPEKQPVGRFSPTFVEDRRNGLERFLRRVTVHPELSDATCLDTFLRADDMTFQAAKLAKGDALPQQQQQQMNMNQSMMHNNQMMNPNNMQMNPNMNMNQSMMMYPNQHASPPKKEGFKRWFAEAKTSISGDLVKSPDDDLFDEINRYVHGLDSQMKNVSHQASALVRKGKEIANGLFEFGLAFNLLGQSEADALGDALGKMGDTADRLSVLSAEHAEKEMAQFEEPLQDYLKMIHAVKLALQRRHEKRLTYSTCLASVEAKAMNLNKLRSQLGAEAKVYAAEMSLRRGQEAAELARDDFATVSQRVLREVDRFKREKAEDMRRTVLDYINLQVEYNKRMEDIWATLIPQLEKVQLDSNSNAIPVSASEGGAADGASVAAPTVTTSTVPGMPSMQQPQQQQQQAFDAGQNAPVPSPIPAPTAGGDPASMISVQYREPPSAYGGL